MDRLPVRVMGRWGVALAMLGVWGCSGPEPRPLEPAAREAEFRARSLEDPGLRRFADSNPGSTPGTFPPATWDMGALTLAAFYYHPDLDVARARLGQAQAAGATAGMWPNPTAAFDIEKVTNSAVGVKPWVYGFSLSVPIDTLWKRGYKIEEAARQGDAALLALAEAGWHVRSRVRAALADHLFALRELDERRTEETVRAEIVAALERKLALGDIFRLDVDIAQGDLSTARLAIHTAEGRVAETRSVLAAAVGVPGSVLKGKMFEWKDLESLPSFSSLSLETAQTAGLLNRIDLRGLLAEYAAAEAALGRELAGRYPDVSLGPGLLNDQGDRKFTLGLSVTLPVFNQNEGPIAEADARRKEIAARFYQLQVSVIAEVDVAADRYRTALAELGEAEKTLAAVDRREKATRRAIELKELDRTALAGIRLERVQAEAARIAAIRRGQDALGALEDAVQRPLGSAGAPPLPGTSNPRGGAKQ